MDFHSSNHVVSLGTTRGQELQLSLAVHMMKLLHHLDVFLRMACTVLSEGRVLALCGMVRPQSYLNSTGPDVAHCSQRNSRQLGINFSSELMVSGCISTSHDDVDDLKNAWRSLETTVAISSVFTKLL